LSYSNGGDAKRRSVKIKRGDTETRTTSHFLPARSITASSLKVTTFSLKVTAFSLEVTAFGLEVTAFGLEVTAFSLKATTFGLEVTTFSLEVTAFSLEVTTFGLEVYCAWEKREKEATSHFLPACSIKALFTVLITLLVVVILT
jgi:hypothetical protein